MTTNRFITLAANGLNRVVTAISESTGIASALQIVATGTDGKISTTFFPSGIGSASEVIQSSEALSANSFVNIFMDGANRRVRLADSSNNRPANGFVQVAVNANSNATIILQGLNTGLTGLTPGVRYFLAATGGVTDTPNITTSGVICQELGIAISTSSLNFEYNSPIAIA